MSDEKDTKPADEKKAAKAAVPAVCGHRNRHFIPATKDGKPVQSDVLVCTLPDGHQGDHQSAYKTVRSGAVVDAVANWSDAAGKPVQ